MNQRQFIAQFNNNPVNRYSINPAFFKRDDNMTIYYLKLLYKSIQRTMGKDAYFTLNVDHFDEIEDYDQIRRILSKYQDAAIKKSVKLKGAVDNRYNYVDLKSTALKLLVTTFFIEAYDGREMIETLLAVPRVVKKYYYKINNTLRYSMWQLVEATTYNNQVSNTGKGKSPLVVFKNNFPPIKVYMNSTSYNDITGQEVQMTTFEVDAFKKSVPAIEYIFAQMGFYRGLQFMGLDGIFYIDTKPIANTPEAFYTFLPKKSTEIYISVPKSIFHANAVVQHITATLCNELSRKFATYEGIPTREMWLEALGRHFSLTNPRDKANSVLTSFHGTYDLITRENARLPLEDKNDVYNILRWMLYEYNALILKDNLDVSIKRIRNEEYIAGLLAPKINKAVYALSDMGERVNLEHIKKRINIPYDYLINEVTNTSIVVFADTITDSNSFCAIKMSRNGPSAISEGNSNAAMPMAFRYLSTTSLGILDDSASGNSAPGIAGIVCPLGNIYYPGGYFLTEEQYSEPNTWREELFKQLDQVRAEVARKEVVDFKRKILNDSVVPELPITDFAISEEQRQHLIETANR